MIIAAPSREDLMMTPQEREWFRQLIRWQEDSMRSPIILGVPLSR